MGSPWEDRSLLGPGRNIFESKDHYVVTEWAFGMALEAAMHGASEH